MQIPDDPLPRPVHLEEGIERSESSLERPSGDRGSLTARLRSNADLRHTLMELLSWQKSSKRSKVVLGRQVS